MRISSGRMFDPETAKRLSALADYGYFGRRFLDEVNPSGTAASLKAMLEPVGFFQKVKHKGLVGTITSEVGAKAESMLHQQGAVRSVNEMMGTPPKPGLSFPEVNSKTLVDQASRAKNSAIALRSVKNQTNAVAGT
jgi:hypothetical protein